MSIKNQKRKTKDILNILEESKTDKPKRGRGRPRKLTTEVAKDIKEELKSETQEVKRGRGRPKKENTESIKESKNNNLKENNKNQKKDKFDELVVKGKSTLYDNEGEIKMEWIKTEKSQEAFINNIKERMSLLVEELPNLRVKDIQPRTQRKLVKNMMNVYISNDVHFGALHWGEETGDFDWDLKIREKQLKSAYDYLIDNSPNTEECIILDLGDLTEMDDFKNMTPKSGNVLSVDGRFPKILKTAYMSLIYGIEKRLKKHKKVHFINVSGNHDITVSHAVREIVSAWFRNNPRVVVDNSPRNIKYFQHGKTLLQFAHGDGLKMKDRGETMVVDNRSIFSKIEHCYSLFGHNHKDAVVDTKITRRESFRNLASLNDWARSNGYRRGLGTMTTITYSKEYGEIGRNKYSILMSEKDIKKFAK